MLQVIWSCMVCVWSVSPLASLLQVWRVTQIYSSCWKAGIWSRFAQARGRRPVSSNCRKTAKHFGMSPTKPSSETRPVSVLLSLQLVLCVSKKAFNLCHTEYLGEHLLLGFFLVQVISLSQYLFFCQSSPLDLLVLPATQTPPSNTSSAAGHVRCCASHSLRYCSHRQTGKILIVCLCVSEITLLTIIVWMFVYIRWASPLALIYLSRRRLLLRGLITFAPSLKQTQSSVPYIPHTDTAVTNSEVTGSEVAV